MKSAGTRGAQRLGMNTIKMILLGLFTLGLAACSRETRTETGDALGSAGDDMGEAIEEPFEEIDEHAGENDPSADEDDFAPDEPDDDY